MNRPVERLYGVDIARIMAMLLVVLFHAVGILSGYDRNGRAGQVVHAATIGCVDLFALISGYVGIRSKFRPSRFATMWIQAVFTGILVVGFGWALGLLHPSVKDWGKVFMPISSYAYWYLTAYFLLFLISPFINAGFAVLSGRAIAMLVLLLFGCVVLVPTLNPAKSDTYVLSHGLSAMWLIICYIIGGSIRTLDRGWGRCRVWFCASVAMVMVNCFWSGSYAHPAVLLSAVCYFMMCLRVRVGSPVIQRVVVFFSSCAFGVYLWHGQPLLHSRMTGCLQFVCDWSWYAAVPMLVLFSIALYLSVSVLEWSRIRLFKMVKVDLIVRKVDSFL